MKTANIALAIFALVILLFSGCVQDWTKTSSPTLSGIEPQEEKPENGIEQIPESELWEICKRENWPADCSVVSGLQDRKLCEKCKKLTETEIQKEAGNGTAARGENDLPKYSKSQDWEIPSEMFAEIKMDMPEGADVKGYCVEGTSVQEMMNWYKNQITGWTLKKEKPATKIPETGITIGMLIYHKDTEGIGITVLSGTKLKGTCYTLAAGSWSLFEKNGKGGKEPEKEKPAESTTTKQVGEWSKTFGGTEADYAWLVKQTSDKGYILVGGTISFGAGDHDVWLIKTDSSGNEEWNKTFGGTDYDDAHSVQQTSDGGYIIAGSTVCFGAGKYDAWVIKTDGSGNEEWSKTFGGTEDDYAYYVQQTSDRGYVIAGETWSFGAGGKDAWLIKIDSSGNEEWSKTFGGKDGEWVQSVQQTSDKGYIIAGNIAFDETGNHDVLLIKTDSHGNEEWTKTFGGTGDEEGEKVQQTSDGGYILVGGTTSFGNGSWDFWLVKTDSKGNKEWSKTFGGTEAEGAKEVQQTSDKGYILTGKTRSFGAKREDGSRVWNGLLVKTDSSGNEEWSKNLGGLDDEEMFSVIQISDGGYIVAGKTKSFSDNENWDVWLVKYGPEEKHTVASPTNRALASLSMTSSTDGWAVGDDGTIVRWDGSAWSTVASPTGEFLHSVHMLSPTDGWAVGLISRTGGWAMGTGGRIIKWDGSSWSIAAEPMTSSLYSIYMLSSTDGWAVGEHGTIVKWNGSSWSTVKSPPANSFYSVYMLSSTDGWAMGWNGAIIRWNGSTWSSVASPTKSSLLSVYMISSDEGWAVGVNGAIIRWNGSTWSLVSSPTKGSLASVYMLSPTDGWAVGYEGTIIRWDGSSWSSVASHTTNSLYSVQMLSPANGWVVGFGGKIIPIPPETNSPPVIENQKTEEQSNPTHLATLTPALSWDYYDADNDAMEQCQIQVGTSKSDSSLWDYALTRQQELEGAVHNEAFDDLDNINFSNPGKASVEIDPPGQLHYNALAGGESWGNIKWQGWEIPEDYTFEIKTYFDQIGEGQMFYHIINSATLQFIPGFKRTGLVVTQEHIEVPNLDTLNLIVPGVVKYGANAEWQTWKFVVTSDTWMTASTDIYLTDSTHTNQLMAEDVPCPVSPIPGGAKGPFISFETSGNTEVHIDYLKLYYDSGVKTVELIPSVTYSGSELLQDTTYHWRVKCYDGYDWSDWAYGTFKAE